MDVPFLHISTVCLVLGIATKSASTSSTRKVYGLNSSVMAPTLFIDEEMFMGDLKYFEVL